VTTHPDRNKTNWLLGGLILVSIAVHALLFMHLAGVFQSKEWTYIELKLQSFTKPRVREIPRPPRPTEAPPKPRDMTPPKVVERTIPPLKPPQAAPLAAEFPDTIAEAVNPPAPAPAPVPDIASWQPAEKPVPEITEPEPAGAGAAHEFDTTQAYFAMVRLRIEANKSYPRSARRRNIEGRVTVGFVLETDGRATSVKVVKSSRHSILDKAALEAVRRASPFPRPPEHLFHKPIPLRITVAFELM
jgi:protein TonB